MPLSAQGDRALSVGGAVFGGHGNQFLRMNIAIQRARVEDGFSRLKQGVEAYEQYMAESC